jgi:hypothetical protein
VIIENNIPVPGKPVKKYKWPFVELLPGQSFLMPGVKLKSAKNDCWDFEKRGFGTFTAALINDSVVRVWRVA